jgi:hypothetical protein
MKQKVLLFSAFIAMSCLIFTSNKSGTATVNEVNATGGPGSQGYKCSSAGCHNSGIGVTGGAFEVRKRFQPDSNTAVNSYIGDSLYTIHVAMNHTSYHVFGFQMEILKFDDSTSKGTVSNLGSKMTSFIVGGKTLIESKDTFKALGTAADAYFVWKAPPKNTGFIRFYGMITACNGDGTSWGDMVSNTIVFSLAEAVSVNHINNEIAFDVYPNPVVNTLQLHTTNAKNGVYAISMYDIHGRKVYNSSATITNGIMNEQIEMTNNPAGVYILNISTEGYQKTLSVLKE